MAYLTKPFITIPSKIQLQTKDSLTIPHLSRKKEKNKTSGHFLLVLW